MTSLPDRRLSLSLLLCAAAMVALFAGSGVAAAQAAGAANPCERPNVTNFLGADATKPGVVDLHFFHAEGAPVTYFECVRGRAHRLGSLTTAPGTPTVLRGATTWSCDRLVRRFVATAPRADGTLAAGTYSVRTMSCAQRFDLRVPRRVATGGLLRVRVLDTWGIGGIRPKLCVTPARGARSCSALRFGHAVSVVSRRLRAVTRGTLRIELRVRDRRVRRAVVAVGVAGAAAPPAAPTLLATGDSMMQGIDGYLADGLGDAARVRSDIRPGTAISKGSLDWVRFAGQQAARLRPRTTVIAIGANEGWPMTTPAGATIECCDEPWIAEYARRVRTMMQSYLRGGRGRVVWLTLPAPRGGRHVPIFDAVNRAFLRAGAGLPRVTVLRIDLLFSPNGFREVMRHNGRDVRVREPDGIHLNAAGTAIAAAEIVRVLSDEGP